MWALEEDSKRVIVISTRDRRELNADVAAQAYSSILSMRYIDISIEIEPRLNMKSVQVPAFELLTRVEPVMRGLFMLPRHDVTLIYIYIGHASTLRQGIHAMAQTKQYEDKIWGDYFLFSDSQR